MVVVVVVVVIEEIMQFGHEQLDVYRVSLENGEFEQIENIFSDRIYRIYKIMFSI
ncbi:MAG: hypothetical protein JRK53_26250 [Deltaproteobacteria bacterium]|nr:hypothetical protein [Deltaproteobacteria bacterium]